MIQILRILRIFYHSGAPDAGDSCIVSLIAQMHLMKAFPDWALNTGEMSAAKGEGQVTHGWHSCTAM